MLCIESNFMYVYIYIYPETYKAGTVGSSLLESRDGGLAYLELGGCIPIRATESFLIRWLLEQAVSDFHQHAVQLGQELALSEKLAEELEVLAAKEEEPFEQHQQLQLQEKEKYTLKQMQVRVYELNLPNSVWSVPVCRS